MSVLSRFGVTVETLDKFQDPAAGSGRVLLLDGDGTCYQATATAKKLDTAMRRFEQQVLEYMFLAKCESARVHLTPKGCAKNGRHLLNGVKPYQGNRKGKDKPPLLELLRSSASEVFQHHPDIQVFSHYRWEADDALMMDCYSIHNGVLVSEDKDLLIAPTESYDVQTGQFLTLPKGERYGYLELKYTPAGSPRVKGKGTKFWFAQTLMGDTADNIKGILKYDNKLCGAIAAYNILDDIQSEDDAANVVLDGYRKINQNILPEAEALWLLRWEGDSAYNFLKELNLSPANLDFLEDCYNQDWRRDEYHEPEE